MQVSDSNRLEPGAGHLDWTALLGRLGAIGYDGVLAVRVPAVRAGGRGAAGVGAADASGGLVVTTRVVADHSAAMTDRLLRDAVHVLIDNGMATPTPPF